MKKAALSALEQKAVDAAANAGARAAILGAGSVDTKQLSEELAAEVHGVSLSLIEDQHSVAVERCTALSAVLSERRLAFTRVRMAMASAPTSHGAAIVFENTALYVARLAKLIPPAFRLSSPLLRYSLRLAGQRRLETSRKRSEIAASVEAYVVRLESAFSDFKRRAELLKKA